MATNAAESYEDAESEAKVGDDRWILENSGAFLSDGLALKRWFDSRERTEGYSSFDLVRTYNRPDRSRGFFGQAALESRSMPVMGVIDEVLYDRPKAPVRSRAQSAKWMRDQIREFVMRYFLRVSDFRRPQLVPDDGGGVLADLLEPISWRPSEEIERDGMAFSQVFSRGGGSADFEPTPPDERSRVLDLREVGSVRDAVILRLEVYQFNVAMRPLGVSGPQFLVPLKEESYLIVSPDFIRCVDDPEDGVLGEYGLGYAFIKNPRRGPFAYGPGEFEAAFQTITFRVLEGGETWVKMAFVSDQPRKIVNLTLDPVQWSFTLADFMSFGQASRILAPFKTVLEQMPFRDFNLDPTVPALDWMNTLTAGQASQQLSISREELYRGFLRRHSLQHYQTVLGSLRTWRQIPDWLDESALPEWVRTGASS